MITAVVRFRLPQGTTRDDAKALFEKSAPNYRSVPGLVRNTIFTEMITPEEVFISGVVMLPNVSTLIPGRARSHSGTERSRRFCSTRRR
jgi:hypothetical protein